ncbi:MAG: type IV pilus assembly protein PilM [Candidatus Sungbacteria bacterium]|uniref:Type IV pilus assembly protein PilM n=1 Tax=Candidatus Sungiibacteriota bacterium TaxID=2750080 RepID=A0A931WNZ3_9BACT|nr:type IV pilus assembly protein PilM [Candidatus Sungbacteria bacterium]
MAFEFIKKLTLPPLPGIFSFSGKRSFVGIDIGFSSVKVVQLRKENERAILETYGELRTSPYLKNVDGNGIGSGFLRFRDSDIIEMLTDILREGNVTTNQAVLAVPSVSSFVTSVELPTKDPDEIARAVPFEARRYIPIPISEIALNWQIIDGGETPEPAAKTKVLLVAVPKDVVNKFERIVKGLNLTLAGLEIETFSLVRSLVGHDKTITALINYGAQSTTVTIVDGGVVMLSHNIDRGSNELTSALARGLGIAPERAEAFKTEVGLSDRPEDREITSVMSPLVEILISEIERILASYNRKTERRIERIILTGGGSRVKGLIDHTAKRFGLETIQVNPFSRVTYPPFMQQILKDIGPSFAVAVGLALRNITPQ